jgi:4-hydroxy-3-polyprenylbenzoate decarboxylase
MSIIVGITGASGSIYGITVLQELKRLHIETHLVLSRWAEKNICLETDYTPEQVRNLATHNYGDAEMSAAIASGSFLCRGMVVAPCSMKSLASIATGLTDNLIARGADVCIKEGRKLILLPRETPLNSIHLENMLKLSRLGVIIMPPVPAFYHKPETIDDIVKQTVGRVMDMLKIENDIVKRWKGLT